MKPSTPPKEMQCFVCSTTVHRMDPFGPGYSIHSGCYDGGTGVAISGGFGSDYDMESYHGVICDDCIERSIDKMFRLVNVDEKRTYYYEPGVCPNGPQVEG